MPVRKFFAAILFLAFTNSAAPTEAASLTFLGQLADSTEFGLLVDGLPSNFDGLTPAPSAGADTDVYGVSFTEAVLATFDGTGEIDNAFQLLPDENGTAFPGISAFVGVEDNGIVAVFVFDDPVITQFFITAQFDTLTIGADALRGLASLEDLDLTNPANNQFFRITDGTTSNVSNVTLSAVIADGFVPPVPLPASAFLLAGGLVSLRLIRNQKAIRTVRNRC